MPDVGAVNPQGGFGDHKPVPDPTVLTTDQLLRTVDALRELLETQIISLDRVTNDRFVSIESHFSVVERQRLEQKKDTKDAVDAALVSQKEAVGEQTLASEKSIAKSEAATNKQLDQLGTTFAANITGITVLLNDLKERISKIESIRLGGQQQQDNSRGQIQAIAAALSIFIAIATIFGILAAAGVFSK